jgi:hypothetical protein
MCSAIISIFDSILIKLSVSIREMKELLQVMLSTQLQLLQQHRLLQSVQPGSAIYKPRQNARFIGQTRSLHALLQMVDPVKGQLDHPCRIVLTGLGGIGSINPPEQ